MKKKCFSSAYEYGEDMVTSMAGKSGVQLIKTAKALNDGDLSMNDAILQNNPLKDVQIKKR